jgi:hypothetical protein
MLFDEDLKISFIIELIIMKKSSSYISLGFSGISPQNHRG